MRGERQAVASCSQVAQRQAGVDVLVVGQQCRGPHRRIVLGQFPAGAVGLDSAALAPGQAQAHRDAVVGDVQVGLECAAVRGQRDRGGVGVVARHRLATVEPIACIGGPAAYVADRAMRAEFQAVHTDAQRRGRQQRLAVGLDPVA